jgi:hypothetical protein
MRPLPRLVLSRIKDEMRCITSPRAMPPMPVEIMSLKDIGWVSPQHSRRTRRRPTSPTSPRSRCRFARAAL